MVRVKTTTQLIYNFNAGPAMLPKEVMQRAREEFLNYKNTGISVMEMSHRSKEFLEIIQQAEYDLRELLDIPSHYSVLFCSGGATFQFSAVPLNLLEEGDTASYALTGVWAVKAYEEAKKFYPQVKIAFDGKPFGYHKIPNIDEFNDKESKYVYITSNNTIYGTQYGSFPKTSLPLVADMTSELLSRQIPISNFGVIFAGAQKNIGPSGLTIVIVRNDLIHEKKKNPIPILLDWRVLKENQSLYNTPPTYSIYIAGLVFSWLKSIGGIPVIEKINQKKSQTLYQFLDNSSLFYAPVPPPIRSQMNVVFHIREKNLESKFLEEANEQGFIGLAGHRLAGGFRASIYNAMPLEGVEALIDFLKEFERKAG